MPLGKKGFQPGNEWAGNAGGKSKNSLGVLLRSKEKLPQEIYDAVHPLLKSKRPDIVLKAAEFLSYARDGKPAQMLEIPDGMAFPFSVIRPNDRERAA